MSATNRGATVVPNEAYYTPPATIISLCEQMRSDVNYGTLMFREPARGGGAIMSTISDYFQLRQTQWDWFELTEGSDYLADGFRGKVDVIPANPPFSLAQGFIERSLAEGGTVAYLLRLNFLGAKKRKQWWQGRTPTHLFVLSDRPSFVDKCVSPGCESTYHKHEAIRVCAACGCPVRAGTDATEYAWFVWDRLGLMKKPPGVYVI